MNKSFILKIWVICLSAVGTGSCGNVEQGTGRNLESDSTDCLTLTSSTGTTQIGLRDMSGDVLGNELAQSFVFSTERVVDAVYVRVRVVGDPKAGTIPGKLFLTLNSNLQGPFDQPSGDVLRVLEYDFKNRKEFSENLQWIKFALPPDLHLKASAGTKYWIRLEAAYDPSTTAHVKWEGSTSDPYKDGMALKEAASNTFERVESGSHDLFFRLQCAKITDE